MSLFLRTTALMLLMLSRAPAFAAIPTAPGSEENRSTNQNEVCSKAFKHNLSACTASNPHQQLHFNPTLTSTFYTAKRTKLRLN